MSSRYGGIRWQQLSAAGSSSSNQLLIPRKFSWFDCSIPAAAVIHSMCVADSSNRLLQLEAAATSYRPRKFYRRWRSLAASLLFTLTDSSRSSAAASSCSIQLLIPRKFSWIHCGIQLLQSFTACVWLIPAIICCSLQLQQPAADSS